MTTTKITLEDLEKLECGDQVTIIDPLRKEETAYCFMDKSPDGHQYYFMSSYGASLMVNCQKTIDSFKLHIIDQNHPKWDATLSEQVQLMETMIDKVLNDPAALFDMILNLK